jgi:hypothetical protein
MADAQVNHQNARNYWQGIEADVKEMLDGFPHTSRVALQGSKNFLAKLGVGGKSKKKVERVVDCGARYVHDLLLILVVCQLAKLYRILCIKSCLCYWSFFNSTKSATSQTED